MRGRGDGGVVQGDGAARAALLRLRVRVHQRNGHAMAQTARCAFFPLLGPATDNGTRLNMMSPYPLSERDGSSWPTRGATNVAVPARDAPIPNHTVAIAHRHMPSPVPHSAQPDLVDPQHPSADIPRFPHIFLRSFPHFIGRGPHVPRRTPRISQQGEGVRAVTY